MAEMRSFMNVQRPTSSSTLQAAAALLAVKPRPAVRSARESKRGCPWNNVLWYVKEIVKEWSINISPRLEPIVLCDVVIQGVISNGIVQDPDSLSLNGRSRGTKTDRPHSITVFRL